MNNWIELSDSESDLVWDMVYGKFKFKPSRSNFPSFKVPKPFITYDISSYFCWSGDVEEIKWLYRNLEEKSLLAFRELTNENEYVYALDWQHPCYWVNPFLAFPRDEFNEWLVPIFPNGDYYFFLQREFNWGLLGHPWEKSIIVFGHELIQALEKHKPRMFHTILRIK